MKMKNIPFLTNLCLFIITLLLSLSVPYSAQDWEGLNDPQDYLHQSQIPLLDKEFYFPHYTEDFNPRPFTVPLFYKLCGSNTSVIVQMQRVLLALSTFFLVCALLLFIKRSVVKYFLIISIYLLMSWWNITGWTTLILSESVSMSLLFCWMASFLFLLKKNNTRWWVIHLMVMFLFSFTRDTWPYILIAFYSVVCFSLWLWKERALKYFAILLVISTGIFFLQQATAKTGNRYKLPLMNSIVIRLIQNDEHAQWLAKNGMPCVETLQKNFRGIDVRTEAGQERMFRLYEDTVYNAFARWVLAKGQPVYIRFMLTHPAYTLLLEETGAQRSRILAYDLFYIDEPRGYTRWMQFIFPLFTVPVTLVLCFLLMIPFMLRKKQVLLFPLQLAFIVFINVVPSYNADALEVERHLFITLIMVQLIGFCATALLWDAME